jgi:pseudouridine-5'-phosphate glycosidase
MSDNILKSIDGKLTMIIRLLALDVVKGRTLNEQIELLHNTGMSASEIAAALGKTSNNIRVQLHLMKKKVKQTD